jgi:uncharacterized membrane protein
VLPVIITLAVIGWLAGWLGRVVGPGTLAGRALRALGFRFVSNSEAAYALGWGIVVLGLIVLGFFVQRGAVRYLQERADGLLHRIPLLGGVYGTAKQLTGMLDSRKEADIQGMQVVYCRFGERPGTLCLALLATSKPVRVGDAAYHAVLVPTAPVPVGGGLLLVPTDAVEPADMSIDTFMGVYVSMGGSLAQLPSTA